MCTISKTLCIFRALGDGERERESKTFIRIRRKFTIYNNSSHAYSVRGLRTREMHESHGKTRLTYKTTLARVARANAFECVSRAWHYDKRYYLYG